MERIIKFIVGDVGRENGKYKSLEVGVFLFNCRI